MKKIINKFTPLVVAISVLIVNGGYNVLGSVESENLLELEETIELLEETSTGSAISINNESNNTIFNTSKEIDDNFVDIVSNADGTVVISNNMTDAVTETSSEYKLTRSDVIYRLSGIFNKYITISSIDGGEINVILDNFVVEKTVTPFRIDGTTANITLANGSENIITNGSTSSFGTSNKAGLQLSNGGSVVIKGDGTLRVKGANNNLGSGAGIGSELGGIAGDISIIGNANVIATGGKYASAIGSGKSGTVGNILITDSVKIEAVGGLYASAIGSGYEGKSGNISIDVKDSSQLKITSGTYAAGIGSGSYGVSEDISVKVSGYAALDIIGGENGGAGIGSGSNGEVGNIAIETYGESKLVAKGGMYGGAGIGSGAYSSTAGNLFVKADDNSIIDASSGSDGAGIGSGLGSRSTSRVGDIKVMAAKSGYILATTGSNGNGAGIGSGRAINANSFSIAGNVIIESADNGIIEATGGPTGAGIGTGRDGDVGSILISGASGNVVAKGGTRAAGIGTGMVGSKVTMMIDSIIIKDTVNVKAIGGVSTSNPDTAGGAGIGIGDIRDGDINSIGSITIYEGANVKAYAMSSVPAITIGEMKVDSSIGKSANIINGYLESTIDENVSVEVIATAVSSEENKITLELQPNYTSFAYTGIMGEKYVHTNVDSIFIVSDKGDTNHDLTYFTVNTREIPTYGEKIYKVQLELATISPNPTIDTIYEVDNKITGTGEQDGLVSLVLYGVDGIIVGTMEDIAVVDGIWSVSIKDIEWLESLKDVSYIDATQSVTKLPSGTVSKEVLEIIKPYVENIWEGQSTIKGTGQTGATITITLPNLEKALTVEVIDGVWEIKLTPEEILLLEEGQIIVAIQDFEGRKLEAETEVGVINSPPPTIGKVFVGDKVIYGEGGRYGATIILTLEDGTEFTTILPEKELNRKLVNKEIVENLYWKIDITGHEDKLVEGEFVKATQTLKIEGAKTSTVSERKIIKVIGVIITPKEVDDVNINAITADDTTITGTGEVGADITVILENGNEITTTVLEDGTWSVTVNPDYLIESEVVKVIQSIDGEAIDTKEGIVGPGKVEPVEPPGKPYIPTIPPETDPDPELPTDGGNPDPVIPEPVDPVEPFEPTEPEEPTNPFVPTETTPEDEPEFIPNEEEPDIVIPEDAPFVEVTSGDNGLLYLLDEQGIPFGTITFEDYVSGNFDNIIPLGNANVEEVKANPKTDSMKNLPTLLLYFMLMSGIILLFGRKKLTK